MLHSENLVLNRSRPYALSPGRLCCCCAQAHTEPSRRAPDGRSRETRRKRQHTVHDLNTRTSCVLATNWSSGEPPPVVLLAIIPCSVVGPRSIYLEITRGGTFVCRLNRSSAEAAVCCASYGNLSQGKQDFVVRRPIRQAFASFSPPGRLSSFSSFEAKWKHRYLPTDGVD